MCSCTTMRSRAREQEPGRQPEGGVRHHRRSKGPTGCERQARGLGFPLASGLSLWWRRFPLRSTQGRLRFHPRSPLARACRGPKHGFHHAAAWYSWMRPLRTSRRQRSSVRAPDGWRRGAFGEPDRPRDGEDEAADAYSRKLVSADPPLSTSLAGKHWKWTGCTLSVTAGRVTDMPQGKGTRKVYTVETDPKGGWRGKAKGSTRAVAKGDKKAEVVKRTIEVAKKQPKAQVRIKGKNGRIQKELAYPRGSDLKRTPG
jgi:hypothetical protein